MPRDVSTGAVLIGTGLDQVSVSQWAHWQDGLSDSSRVRSQALTGVRLKQFVASRYWLETLFRSVTDSPLGIVEQRDGPPRTGESGRYLALSHSHSAVMVGFSLLAPLGVDIEYRKSRNTEPLAQAYFHPRECKRLAQQSPDSVLDVFYQLWTAKEALAKLRGSGLTGAALAADVNEELRVAGYGGGSGEMAGFCYSIVHGITQPLPVYRLDMTAPWQGLTVLQKVSPAMQI